MKKIKKESGKWKAIVMTCIIIAFHFPLSTFHSVSAQTAIGHWRSCLDHSMVNHVAYAGDRVYAGTRGGVFCYDLDYLTLTTMSKGDGLNDVGVATMNYDAATRCLVVAYNNSNVDLVIDGHACNISDIKRSEISGDKGIYHVRFSGGMAYLATGFGVVVVDIDRCEIRETWYLGAGGSYTPVYDLAFFSDSIYASTGEGMKRIAAADKHPGVSDRWSPVATVDSLTFTIMEPFGERLLIAGYLSDPDTLTLYERTATGFRPWNKGVIHSMRVGGGLVTLTRESSVVRYNANLERYDSTINLSWIDELTAHDAVTAPDGTLWVGNTWSGLIHIHSDGSDDVYLPSGPFSGDHCYRLVPFGSRMMLCPGGHTTTFANVYYAPDIPTEQGRKWYTLRTGGLLAGTSDLLDVAVNPLDTNESIAALWGSGLAIIRGIEVQGLYNASNTDGALVPYTYGSDSRLNTGAVEFDREGNLWVLNSQSTHALAVRKSDGTWKGFPTSSMVSNPMVDKLVVDSITGYKWFMGRQNIIYVHDGVGKMAKVNPNHGSKLNTESVSALVQDQSGNLWLGTNKGIKVIYDGYKAFQNGGNGEEAPVNCSNITITNGEFAEYLMAYESITAIAVDGANRKWVGTASGGLYLISANGMEQLEHFTTTNSPLFSDKIVTLGIHERSGEVYIGTDKGLQAYRGTAIYAESAPWEEVYAFPNPVKPDYDGPIAIKGFTRNANVHITDAAGHTVYSTTANGGQAIWNGRTLSGERVASGVYYVFASDEEGNNRSVGKILMIR